MALALGVVWSVAVVLSLGAAGADLNFATDTVRAARSQADPLGDTALGQLRVARERFEAGHRRLSSPVMAPAALVPVLGRQVAAVRAMSGAAVTAVDAGLDALVPARGLVDRPLATNEARAETARLLGDLASTAAARLEDLDLGPRSGLLGPVAEARAEFAGRLEELRDALTRGAGGARAVSSLLDSPRRYLVFGANNAEMRAGSGMLLTIGEMQTGPDGIRLGQMSPVTDYIPIPADASLVEGDLRDRWGWLNPNRDWRNLMLSPRFDVQAPLAARLWEASGRGRVDGVLAVDPVALAGLMTATGPVEAAGRTFAAGDVVRELTHDQYLRFPPDEANAERRDALGELASKVFDSVSSSGSVRALAKGLGPVVEGRHLLAWAARPAEQANWRAAGVDGALDDRSLLVGVLNRSGTKLDVFLDVDADLRLGRVGGGTEATLELIITNNVPAGEPTYVAGPVEGSGLGPGVYGGLVAVTLPGAARAATVEGADLLSAKGPDGPTQVVAVPVTVARGATARVVVRFRLPEPSGTITVEPSARVPAIDWTAGGLRWSDSRPFTLYW